MKNQSPTRVVTAESDTPRRTQRASSGPRSDRTEILAATRPSLEAGLLQHVPAVLGVRLGRGQSTCLLALLAVTAGEIEVALEVTRLANDLRTPQDEVVRLEEPAKVDVGEDTRRRRV